MKINIGPYKDWIGPYQIAEKIIFWNKDKAHSFGRFLATGSFTRDKSKKLFDDDQNLTWFNNLLVWIHSKKSRKIEVRIDNYDVWNADTTLTLIILPMLEKIKETQQGSSFVEDEDVPENLRSTSAEPKENEWDWDSNNEVRWNWVLDEMIWAFQQLHPDCDWEDQYHRGKIEFSMEPAEGGCTSLVRGPGDTHVFDREGYKAHSDRIRRGTTLFGKYFRSLWT